MWDVTDVRPDIFRHCNFYSHIPCGMRQTTVWIGLPSSKFLLTHPVWDVTGVRRCKGFRQCNFYSHIPCGMWQLSLSEESGTEKFLLTHPVWDVTEMACFLICIVKISTRTSRVGCDRLLSNPVYAGKVFLLTHPVWDVTNAFCRHINLTDISTHTSRVGCDREAFYKGYRFSNFYSHIPCGMWQVRMVGAIQHENFYSHIPCGMWRDSWRMGKSIP